MDRVANLPLKIPTPWASGAKTGFVRPIPAQSQIGVANGAASYVDGFPPLTFTPVSAGGVPPFGQDMNGILKHLSEWSRWTQAGGLVRYDSTFQSAIAGYPAEARVGSNTVPWLVWQSTANNNMSNPDIGGGGWQTPVFPDVSATGKPLVPGFTVQAAAPATNTSLGANFALFGNTIQSDGRTSVLGPKKWLRVYNGNFAVINDAYTAEIFTLTNAGDIYNVHNINAGGAVTASVLTANNDATVVGTLSAGAVHVTGATNYGGYNLWVDGSANVTGRFVTPVGGVLNGYLPNPGLAPGVAVGNIGFTPVQQGGGWEQGANKVFMGWATTGAGLKVQVDSTDLGPIGFLWRSQTWSGTQTFQNTSANNYWGGTFSGNYVYSSGNIDAAGSITAAYMRSSGNLNVNGAAGIDGGLHVTGNIDTSNSLYAAGLVQASWIYSTGSAQIENGLNVPNGHIDTGGHVNAADWVQGRWVASTAGDITAQNGKLRASYGSSGDANAATLLGEFSLSGGYSGWFTCPSGFMIQWFSTEAGYNMYGIVNSPVNLPRGFPNVCLASAVSLNGSGPPPWDLSPGISSSPLSQWQVNIWIGRSQINPTSNMGINVIAIGY